jgi:High-temperature-induced dauer-formation protein
VRDTAPENLETLLLALTGRLFSLRHHPAFPDGEIAPAKEALNCVRVLTRIFPFFFETEDLGEWGQRFWWTPGDGIKGDGDRGKTQEVLFEGREEDIPLVEARQVETGGKKALAAELLDTLLDLLSFAGFTVPATAAEDGGSKVTLAIWYVRLYSYLLKGNWSRM